MNGYIHVLPLADCVSLMVRRMKAGKSPFVADRGHIHHYLLARGFTPSQTLAILVGASVISPSRFGGWARSRREAASAFLEAALEGIHDLDYQ